MTTAASPGDPVIELARQVEELCASAGPVLPHPRTGRRQRIEYDKPRIEESGAGSRTLVVTLRDRKRPKVTYGYRITLPPGWERESPPGMVAGLITTELLEIIEAAGMGLPLHVERGQVCWLSEP